MQRVSDLQDQFCGRKELGGFKHRTSTKYCGISLVPMAHLLSKPAETCMFTHLNPFKVALSLAIVTGSFHLCWSMLVALGWAQPVIDFVFWAHFIMPIYVIERFELVKAVALLLMTASIGFILGLVFGMAWNALHGARSRPA